MAYEVEFTNEFEAWWNSLTDDEQKSVAFSVRLLEEQGIHLKRPHADAIHGSKYVNFASFDASTRGVRIGSSMPSILGAPLCC